MVFSSGGIVSSYYRSHERGFYMAAYIRLLYVLVSINVIVCRSYVVTLIYGPIFLQENFLSRNETKVNNVSERN